MEKERLKKQINDDLQTINSLLEKSYGDKHLIGYCTSDYETYAICDYTTRRSAKMSLEDIATEVEQLRKLVESGEPLRICSVCGNLILWYGYVEDAGTAYYCSNECLLTKHTKEEWKQMCEDNDQTYWTEWNY